MAEAGSGESEPVTTGVLPVEGNVSVAGWLIWKVVAVVRATTVVPAAMATPAESVPVRTMLGTKLASGLKEDPYVVRVAAPVSTVDESVCERLTWKNVVAEAQAATVYVHGGVAHVAAQPVT